MYATAGATIHGPFQSFCPSDSKLSRTGPDTELRRWMQERYANYTAGKLVELSDFAPLERLLEESSLQCEVLLDLGRAFAFLEGDELAACWYRAGLTKAQRQYKDTPSGEPGARRLLHLMDQTKALWRLSDYLSLEKRFALAIQLNPRLSAESRRAGYLHAEALYNQGRRREASDAILAVRAAHELAGDLGSLDRTDVHEFNWVVGIMLFDSGQYEAALAPLTMVISSPGEHTPAAHPLLIFALARLDHVDRAEAALSRYSEQVPNSPHLFDLRVEVASAKARKH